MDSVIINGGIRVRKVTHHNKRVLETSIFHIPADQYSLAAGVLDVKRGAFAAKKYSRKLPDKAESATRQIRILARKGPETSPGGLSGKVSSMRYSPGLGGAQVSTELGLHRYRDYFELASHFDSRQNGSNQ